MSRLSNLTVINSVNEKSTFATSTEDTQDLDDLDLKIDESDLSDEVDLPKGDSNESNDSLITKSKSGIKSEIDIDEHIPDESEDLEAVEKELDLLLTSENEEKSVDTDFCNVKENSSLGSSENGESTVKDVELTESTVKDKEIIESVVDGDESTVQEVKDVKSTETTVKDVELTEPTVEIIESVEPAVKDAESIEPTVDDIESIEATDKDIESIEPAVKDVESTEPAVKDVEPTEPTVKDIESTEPKVKDVELTESKVKDVELAEPAVKVVQNVEKLVDKGGGDLLEASQEIIISDSDVQSTPALGLSADIQEKPPSSNLVETKPVSAPVERREKDVLDEITKRYKRGAELEDENNLRKRAKVDETKNHKKEVAHLTNGFRKKVTNDVMTSVKEKKSGEKEIVKERAEKGRRLTETRDEKESGRDEKVVEEDKENLPARDRLFASYFRKKPVVTVNRELMEEMLMVRVVDYLASKSDVAQLRQRCKFLENEQTRLIKLTNGLKKHVEDAKHIIRKLIDEKMNSQPWTNSIVPLRVTRSVGLQVCTCGSERVTEALLKEANYVRPRRSVLNKKSTPLGVLSPALQKPVAPDEMATLNGITRTNPAYSSNSPQVMNNTVVNSPNSVNTKPPVVNNSVPRVVPTNGSSPSVPTLNPTAVLRQDATPRAPGVGSPLSRSGELSGVGGKRPRIEREEAKSVDSSNPIEIDLTNRSKESGPRKPSAVTTPIEIDLTSRSKESGTRKPSAPTTSVTTATTTKLPPKKQGVEEIIDLTDRDEVQTGKSREIPITKSSPGTSPAVRNTLTPSNARGGPTPSPNPVSSPNKGANNSSMTSVKTAVKKPATATEPAPVAAKRPSTEIAQNSKIDKIAPIGADLLESQGQLPKFPSQPRYPAGTPRPPRPILRIGIKKNSGNTGIMLSWTFGDNNKNVANIDLYQLYAYQESSKQVQEPTDNKTETWKKVGDIKALPLPMACFLTQFLEGNKYHFIVRAVDFQKRIGDFSLPGSIVLQAKSNEEKPETKSKT